MNIELTAETEIDRPAAHVWALVADYDHDPEWRAGVTTMAPMPAGPVTPATITAEVVRFGGRTFHNGGEVTGVETGTRFAWRTVPGADVDAEGSRSVEPLDPGRCRVRLELRVRPGRGQGLVAPLLRAMLRRGLTADLARLRALAESARSPREPGTGRTPVAR